MKHWLMIVLVTICCACHAGKPETLAEGGYDEADMSAAIARAKSELKAFIAALESGKGTNFAIKVRNEDISDWLFMRDGKMYGNYTLRPLLATMPEEAAAYYKAMLAEP